MTDRKDPKKSESLEARVPWRLKQEFMARARREGRSASEVIRDLMQDYVRRPAQRTTQTLETAMTAIRKRPRISAGGAAIIGAAAISAILSGAIPAGAASDLETLFEQLDANGDGVVTAEEMEPVADSAIRPIWRPGPSDAPQNPQAISPRDNRVRAFATFDADGNGGLSMQEFIARHEARIDSFFASLDRNGDGAISMEEEGVMEPIDALGQPRAGYAFDLRTILRPADTDGDSHITREEMGAAVGPTASARL